MEKRRYNIQVYFDKDMILQDYIQLVAGDYNSVEFDFTFDRDDGIKVFSMVKPDGTKWVKEIENGVLELSAYDENDNPQIVINDPGDYTYEVSLFDENGQLTKSENSYFTARKGIEINDLIEESDDRVPILTQMINTMVVIFQNAEQVMSDLTRIGNKTQLQGDEAERISQEIESKAQAGDYDGTTFTPSVDDNGNLSWTNDGGKENPPTKNIKGQDGATYFSSFDIVNGDLIQRYEEAISGANFNVNNYGELEVII